MLIEEPAYKRRPYWNGFGRIDEEVAVASERREHSKLRFPARLCKCLVHSICQVRAEVCVVLRVNPKHWYAGFFAEIARCFDELVGCAIVVRLPSTRPPRPAAKVMIARTDDGFRLDRAMVPHPPPDWPTTMAFPGATVASFCMKSITH